MSRKLLGSAATYTVANLLSSVVPVLLVPVLTRLLSPHDYGIVAVFNAAAAFLGVVIGLGVPGLVPIEYHRLARADVGRLVSACLAIAATSLGVVLVATLLVWPRLAAAATVPVGWMLLASGLAGLQFVVALRLSVLQAQKLSSRYAVLQLGQSVASAVLSIALIAGLQLAWRGRILGIALASALLAATSLYGLWRDGLLAHGATAPFVRKAGRYGLTLLPHVAGALSMAWADQVVVAARMGTRAAGLFSVALAVAAMIKVVTIALNRAWAPWLYEHLPNLDAGERLRVARYTWLYFVSVAVGSAAFGAAAPFAMTWLVGPQFAESGRYVLVLALGFGFGGMYFAVTNYVFHAGATARLAAVTSSAGALNLGLSWWLIGRFGLAGAGYAFVLAQAVLFLGTWRLAQAVCPMPWLEALRRAPARAAG
jgi:O-antigen/teichoic acid export membrane protein